MEYSNFFRTIGFSPHEQALYLTLLNTPSLTISELARKAKLHRPIVYKTIATLTKKGILHLKNSNRRKIYEVNHPSLLKQTFLTQSKEGEAEFSELLSLQKVVAIPEIKIVRGRTSITEIFRDLVNSLGRNDIFYRYSSPPTGKVGDSYLPPDYRLIRDEKELERFVITSGERFRTRKTRLERGMKILPRFDQENLEATEIIYGDKVAFIDYATETGFVIQHEKFAKFTAVLFMELYKKLPE